MLTFASRRRCCDRTVIASRRICP